MDSLSPRDYVQQELPFSSHPRKYNSKKDPYRFGACPVCGKPLKVRGALTCSIACRDKNPAHQEKMKAYGDRLRQELCGEGNHFWGRAHSEETRQHLREKNTGAEVPEERRKRIAEALSGKERPYETRKKISKSKQGQAPSPQAYDALRKKLENETDEERQARSQLCSSRQKAVWANMPLDERREKAQRLTECAMQTKVSSIERAVCAVLDELGIWYLPQYPICWYFADVYVPSRNLIIECDGDYWHDYERFPWRKRHDERRDGFIKGLGYGIVRLKEKDIRTDVRGVTLQALNSAKMDVPDSLKNLAQ